MRLFVEGAPSLGSFWVNPSMAGWLQVFSSSCPSIEMTSSVWIARTTFCPSCRGDDCSVLSLAAAGIGGNIKNEAMTAMNIFFMDILLCLLLIRSPNLLAVFSWPFH